MDSTRAKRVVLVEQILAVRRTIEVLGQVVLAFDSSVDGGETHLVTVVGGGSLVVDDAERVVMGLAGGFTVSKPVNAVVDIVGGAFDHLLHEIRVQVVCFFTKVVVDRGFGFALAGYAVLVGVPPRPVCGTVRAALEFVVGGVEVTLAVVGHVEADPHGSSYFSRHMYHSNAYSLLINFNSFGESALLCSVVCVL